jgi:hydrogenase maturation protease
MSCGSSVESLQMTDDEGRKMDAFHASLVLRPPSLIVLGLGNPLLGDDGVGWRVAEECAARIANDSEIEIDCFARGGLSLMERMIGYDRAILIDAVSTGQLPAGAVDCFPLMELQNPNAGHLASAHDATLQTALDLGRALGAHLPGEVLVVAIEAEEVYDFSEALSPAVAAAVPRAVEIVIGQIAEWSGRCVVERRVLRDAAVGRSERRKA